MQNALQSEQTRKICDVLPLNVDYFVMEYLDCDLTHLLLMLQGLKIDIVVSNMNCVTNKCFYAHWHYNKRYKVSQ